jgi:tetratricopeptide (TPR) repeat protein
LDRARLLHALVSTALVTDNNLDLLALTTEAVQLLPADAPAALKAQILAVHARANADRARHDDAVRWAREAFSLADDLGLVAVAADAATTLANLDNRAGDPREVEEALVKAVAKARSGREVTAELRGLFNLGVLYYEQGRLARAQEVYNETWQRAKATGRPGLRTASMPGPTRPSSPRSEVTGQPPPPSSISEASLHPLSPRRC